MPNYRETAVSGTQWTRCRQVFINNFLDTMPTIELVEEEVSQLGSTKIMKGAGSIFEKFDPVKEIKMLDPSTDAETGEVITYNRVYEILYSLYIGLAKERDNNI